MKKNILLIIIISFIVIIGLGLFFISRQNKQQLSSTNKESSQNITQQTEPVENGIIVPDNVIRECNSQYFTEKVQDTNTLKSCDEFSGGPVCAYYQENNKGQIKIKALQFKTECHACRYFTETGETETAGIKMTSLGWQKKSCN